MRTGVALTYETVRDWCLKFGQTYANGLRRRSPRPGDRWHLDEVFLKINGEQPSGEFTSANQIAGEADEAVQVSGSRPTLSRRLRDHHVILPTWQASLYGRRL